MGKKTYKRTKPLPSGTLAFLGAAFGTITLLIVVAITEQVRPSREAIWILYFCFPAPLLVEKLLRWPHGVVAFAMVNAIYYALIFVIIRRIYRYFRPLPLIDYLACSNCLYNLTGNESGVCPECGTSVTQSTIAKATD